MKVHRFWGVMAAVLLAAAPALAAVRTVEQETKIVDGFIEAVQGNKELDADQAKRAVDAASALKTEDEGRPIAITEGLRQIYPAFGEALKAVSEEDLSAAETSLADLTKSADPYLAADASYYHARVMLLQERYEEALPLLDSIEEKFADKSMRAGEALFLKGVAQSQMLKRKDAIVSLDRYLKENPNAPERMKIGAWRQLEQLKLIEEGTLSDVFAKMEFSRRRLALEDSGKPTQEEQRKIVAILEQLIKEAEEKECNCKGSGKGKPKPGEKDGKGGSESEGSADGQGQGGETGGKSNKIDGSEVERLTRKGPNSQWSNLRDKDREAVFNGLKQKFPGRYKDLIEQYYKSFEQDDEG